MISSYINVEVKDFKALKILTAVLLMLNIIISLACYRQELETISYAKENERLKLEIVSLEGQIEMQSSVISDLEENCKNLYIKLEGR